MGSERFELPRFLQTGATTQRHHPLGQLPNFSTSFNTVRWFLWENNRFGCLALYH